MAVVLQFVSAAAFTVQAAPPHRLSVARLQGASMAQREPFAVVLDLAPRGKCNLRFKPLFDESECVVVKYDLPFGLNVENQKGVAVCTKAGTGGEIEGDVLRYCTEWNIGLPGGEASPGATIASFSGAGLGWKLGLFDVIKATSWDDVVTALTSNTQERTDSVTLVFERPHAAARLL